MSDTKEKILMTALVLFADKGYEATSMRDIAGLLNISQSALYKHYSGKRDIFDCIVRRMEQNDAEESKKCSMPDTTYDKAPQSYREVDFEALAAFTENRFCFWTENEFASRFRRFISLERYRNDEMSRLYSAYFGSGVLDYLEDVFRGMQGGGAFTDTDAVQLAVEFFAPFYMLMNIYDSSEKKPELSRILRTHIESFFNTHTERKKQ